MTLLGAHRILIGSAIAVFAGYAGCELYSSSDPGAWVRAALSGVAALGLAVYLRWVWIRRPGAKRQG